MILEGAIFWVLKKKDDLIHWEKSAKRSFENICHWNIISNLSEMWSGKRKTSLGNVLGKIVQLNKYHLKAVWSKMLKTTILFPFTNSSPRVFSHLQNRCHFENAELQNTKKSASLKNTVVLSSYLLVENMCVLNTNYLFSSVFSWENKNFLVQLQSKNKMVSEKSN